MDINYQEVQIFDDEQILYNIKPNKKIFIINNILKMFPFVLIWLMFDIFFIYILMTTNSSSLSFIISFFTIHLLPVWVWLFKTFTSNKRWKNTKYIITDKRIIVKTGIINTNIKNIFYKDITDINLQRSLIGKDKKTGNLYILRYVNFSYNPVGIILESIDDIDNIYSLIQKYILNSSSDKSIYKPNFILQKEEPSIRYRK